MKLADRLERSQILLASPRQSTTLPQRKQLSPLVACDARECSLGFTQGSSFKTQSQIPSEAYNEAQLHAVGHDWLGRSRHECPDRARHWCCTCSSRRELRPRPVARVCHACRPRHLRCAHRELLV